jgi:hypothetical protein
MGELSVPLTRAETSCYGQLGAKFSPLRDLQRFFRLGYAAPVHNAQAARAATRAVAPVSMLRGREEREVLGRWLTSAAFFPPNGSQLLKWP